MNLDPQKVEDSVLALLILGASGDRAWKGLDLDVLIRLHEKGLIGDPIGKSPTVPFTPEGIARAKQLVVDLFSPED
jgi:hypothetical protein